jgi:hypothetical protein
MSGVITAVAGAAVLGAVVSTNNTNKAISAQQSAASAANNTQSAMYDQNRADNLPMMDARNKAMSQLGDLTTNGFQYDKYSDPGLAFQMKMGQDAINRQTANRGGILAGSTLGALENYAQGVGSSAYSGAFNRYQAQIGNLMSIAGLGQNAGAQVGASGTNAANQISSNTMNAGNGQAAGYLANSNQITGTLNNMGNQFMNYQLMGGGSGTTVPNGYLNTNPSGGALFGSGNGGTEVVA